ncbi:uncharacterized protein B0H18DRAFT_905242 [Fomitopsis serialis]|uniref:uncharacterized protein n=1 Tax=Fomitopsis serialis TaxID=139415 RepID=UPI00200810F1|nr:uncharacterized protein B0H18DRAFT_905242 [Neoantrodia serialis]KAH9930634.1 hypothetical protein B0H18DRAFT_905242 [Neoantrodia serialis]
MPGDTAGSMLERLNQDVCRHILFELSVVDLLSLSMTCHWLREPCMPLLFGRSYLTVYAPDKVVLPGLFLPTSLRPYVQYVCLCLRPRQVLTLTVDLDSSMIIRDECLDQRNKANMRRPPHFTDDLRLCGAYPGAALAERLQELPHLRSLTIHKVNDSMHGLCWDTLSAVLSIPHLREFKVKNLYFCPILRAGEQLDIDIVAPITSFQFRMWHPREPFTFPSETVVLSAILSKLCETLETLVLTSEPAPLSTLSQLRWPRLRRITFYGTPWTTLPAPFVSHFSGMSGLRCISLKLNPPPHTVPQALWPPGYACSFPWPELERLVISYPDPQDGIYEHLPLSLRALSLRCWYHLYVQQQYSRFGASHPPTYDALLSSSAMLSILHQCNRLNLNHLEIEYRADNEDDALLQYVVATFPHLVSLKIHRYRSHTEEWEGRDAPVARIAQTLAALTQLRRLKVYLDLLETPHTTIVLHDAAAVFAQLLSSSLNILIIRSPSDPSWYTFDVIVGCAHERQEIM